MAYKYDRELAPAFMSKDEVSETEQPNSWLKGTLKRVFNKRNAFVLMQFTATVSLALSGALGNNQGRMLTGIGNSVKNGSWLGLKNLPGRAKKNPLERDISDTRGKKYGALVSAATNIPQFAMNLAPVFMAAAGAVAWGDVIGAGMGVAAYGIMAYDQHVEAKRLKKFQALGDRMYPDNPEIWQQYDIDKRNVVVGYKERGKPVREFMYNKLPSMLLMGRGAMFTAAAAATIIGGGGVPAFLMAGAGLIFTYGAYREYQAQNYRDYDDVDQLSDTATTLDIESAKERKEEKKRQKEEEKAREEEEGALETKEDLSEDFAGSTDTKGTPEVPETSDQPDKKSLPETGASPFPSP